MGEFDDAILHGIAPQLLSTFAALRKQGLFSQSADAICAASVLTPTHKININSVNV
jgi:hypothetical protein